jgi:hypothetical protein
MSYFLLSALLHPISKQATWNVQTLIFRFTLQADLTFVQIAPYISPITYHHGWPSVADFGHQSVQFMFVVSANPKILNARKEQLHLLSLYNEGYYLFFFAIFFLSSVAMQGYCFAGFCDQSLVHISINIPTKHLTGMTPMIRPCLTQVQNWQW